MLCYEFARPSRTGNALGVQEIGSRHLNARCFSLMGGKEICKIVKGGLPPAVDQGFRSVRKLVGLQRHMPDMSTDRDGLVGTPLCLNGGVICMP